MKKIAVGMSGGVDSAVTAWLLHQKGYEVTGVYLRMIPQDNWQKSMEDARAVAEKIGIPFTYYDIRKEFQEAVIRYFTDAYFSGITPNPCIICNREIKFKLFFNLARELGISNIATGHYLRLEEEPDTKKLMIRKAKDLNKDQTYFLYYLSQEVLRHSEFPLGEYTKQEVKDIAEKAGLPVARKQESQEICFIPENDYKAYLLENFGKQAFTPGQILDRDWKVVGTHHGLPFYTIGQRKGLGVAMPYPAYVTGFDKVNNRLFIGRNQDLFSSRLVASSCNLVHKEQVEEGEVYDIKIRYSLHTAKGTVRSLPDNRLEVSFFEPQRAITPGQSMVFYQGEILIGGGIITEVE